MYKPIKQFYIVAGTSVLLFEEIILSTYQNGTHLIYDIKKTQNISKIGILGSLLEFQGSRCYRVTELCLTFCDPMDCSTSGPPFLHLELAETHVHWVGDAIQPSHPLPLPSPPALNLSQYQVFSSESAFHIGWPNYWSLSFSISPSNEYSGLISFRTDWFDLLAVQGTLKNLLQHHSSKASILQCSAFFMVQLSHSCMTPGKNHSFDYGSLLWVSRQQIRVSIIA